MNKSFKISLSSTALKRNLGFLILFLGIGTSLFAQDQGGRQQRTPQQRADMQTKMMAQKLGLNEEQTQKVAAINLIYANKQDSIRANGSDRRAMFQSMRQTMQNKDADMKTILTAGQFQTYTQMQADMRQKMMDRRSGGQNQIQTPGTDNQTPAP